MIRKSVLLAATISAVLIGAAATLAQPPSDLSGSWTPPHDAQISFNKANGRVSVTMPSEFHGREMVDAQFNGWRRVPYAGTGPMAATRVEVPSLPTHTLYYPEALPDRLPVVLWANGGCRNTSVEFTRFLGELASFGYFIVAVGRNDVPFANFDGNDPIPGPGEPPITRRGGQVMIDGLDWAAAENARRGSPYFGKLDLTKVAALGQSCGGGQAWQAARDPRVRAVAALNSNFPTATSGIGPEPAPQDDWTVERLAIPAAFFVGGPADGAYTRSQTSFAATPATAQVIRANLPEAGHYGAYARPMPRWVTAVTGWLDWQLKDDVEGKAMFAGPDCGLCDDPQWWLETKNVN